MAPYIGGFAGKKQCAVDRRAKRFLGAVAAYFSVAISASRKRVGLPVVAVRIFQQTFKFRNTDAEQAIQGLKGMIDNKRFIFV